MVGNWRRLWPVIAGSVMFLLLAIAGTGALTAASRSASFASASSQASKIVFAGETEGGTAIYAINADGRGLRRLTRTGYDDDPTVSPDGSRIAFGRITDRGEFIVAMNADGTGQRRVGRFDGTFPAWSPDGTRIAYVGERDIYVVNADGSDARSVATDARFFGVAWSPDGKQIAYGVKDAIALVRVDGSGRRVLTTRSGAAPWRPAWSPDGTRIAFLNDGGLWVTNVDGSGERMLDAEAEGPPTPAWSPDGTRILFKRDAQIYKINADGTGERRLTRSKWGEEFDGSVWSPDGRQIAFLRGRFPGCCERNDIWVMNADGTGAHALTNAFEQDGAGDGEPVWALGMARGGAPAARLRMVSLPVARELRGLPLLDSTLAADGRRAAVAISDCHVLTWDARIGRIQRAPYYCEDEERVDLAVAGRRTAWITYAQEGHSIDQATLYLSDSRARAKRITVADHVRGDYLGNLDGDGALLVFNTWREADSGAVSQPRLWRLDRARMVLVRAGASAVSVVAVDSGRIATLGRRRSLRVLDAQGRRLSGLRIRGDVQGVELEGSDLVVLGHASLTVYDASSGKTKHRWPVRPGLASSAHLEDVQGGLAVYTAGLAIHLLRLSDGRDLVLRLKNEGAQAHAQLEPAGLFYAYSEARTKRPGRIGFVPLRNVLHALKGTR